MSDKAEVTSADQPFEIYDFIATSDLFAELNRKSTEQVARRMRTARYAKDEIICNEGDAGNRMYIIVAGEVVILKDMGWGQRELQRMHSGETFGEMALISKERRSATVKAVAKTLCLQFDQKDFDELLDQDPHFAQRVAQLLNRRLADLGDESSRDLLKSYRALIFSLAGLAESRDPETGAHLERTRGYCTLLADLLLRDEMYDEIVHPSFVDGINYVSPLHDIGKVAIPDSILLKPGKLTDEEFEVMKTHSTAGAMALKRVIEQSDQEVFQMAYRVCLHHHEKWDGTGYPIGFAGKDIPIEARIMAVADVFDALLSKRVYKPQRNFDEAIDIMVESSGSHFDPVLIDTFYGNRAQFESIYKNYTVEA